MIDENYGGSFIYGENLPDLNIEYSHFANNKDTGDFKFFLEPGLTNMINKWDTYSDNDQDGERDLGRKCTTYIQLKNPRTMEI